MRLIILNTLISITYSAYLENLDISISRKFADFCRSITVLNTYKTNQLLKNRLELIFGDVSFEVLDQNLAIKLARCISLIVTDPRFSWARIDITNLDCLFKERPKKRKTQKVSNVESFIVELIELCAISNKGENRVTIEKQNNVKKKQIKNLYCAILDCLYSGILKTKKIDFSACKEYNTIKEMEDLEKQINFIENDLISN